MIQFLVAALCILTSSVAPASAETLDEGRAIYRSGNLPAGASLKGMREIGAGIEGAAAACVSCHRRSGLGSAEGNIVIPPITAKYLYRPERGRMEDVDLQYAQGHISLNHGAYDDATLARAISEGIGRDGRKLNALMPRYKLDAAAMSSLIAYLKSLGQAPVPGVTGDTLHFATVITPDADPLARRGMLDVLDKFFTDKNEFIKGGLRRMQDYKEINFRVSRRWQLHVWELAGTPDTWERQLRARMAQEPVFAVISGLSGTTWEPVHRFCETEGLPCLFPNVVLPMQAAIAERSFYPLYFSRGIWLEVDLMAKSLEDGALRSGSAPHRVVQVFRRDDVGASGAAAVEAALKARGVPVTSIALGAQRSPEDVGAALRNVGPEDGLLLWLRPSDLEGLPQDNVPSGTVIVSGLMGGMDDTPLPLAWRRVARMSYPVDLPSQRMFRTNFPHAWFRIRHIPVVADQVQSDTYLACGILAETLVDMLDSFDRDYLVERIESMVSRRTLTGYYPRLGLAPGQRFASKGGYLISFTGADFRQPTADGDWHTP